MGTLDTMPAEQLSKSDFLAKIEEIVTVVAGIFAGSSSVENLTPEQQNAFYFAIALNQFCGTEIYTDDGYTITI